MRYVCYVYAKSKAIFIVVYRKERMVQKMEIGLGQLFGFPAEHVDRELFLRRTVWMYEMSFHEMYLFSIASLCWAMLFLLPCLAAMYIARLLFWVAGHEAPLFIYPQENDDMKVPSALLSVAFIILFPRVRYFLGVVTYYFWKDCEKKR